MKRIRINHAMKPMNTTSCVIEPSDIKYLLLPSIAERTAFCKTRRLADVAGCSGTVATASGRGATQGKAKPPIEGGVLAYVLERDDLAGGARRALGSRIQCR
jgi:hypothetical protein